MTGSGTYLFQKQEEAHKMALEDEEKLLKRLMKSGLKTSDIARLTDKAFQAVEAENWQPNNP